jgi:hypothetical protein
MMTCKPATILKVAALSTAALLWACSDDPTPPATDTGPVADVTVTEGGQPDGPLADGPLTDGPLTDGPLSPDMPVQRDAGIKGTDYVFDTLRLPMTAALTTQYALEHKGTKYNKLGDMLGALVPTLKIKGLPESVQNAICTGEAINLLRVKANNFTSQPQVIVDSWVGAKTACCTANCISASRVCSGSAKTKCFNGSGAFAPDPAHTAASPLLGRITAGKLATGPAALKLKLSLARGGTGAVLNLKGAVIKGAITKANITTGVLAGGVPAAEMGSVVLPQLATILNNLIKDPTTPPATKTAVLAALDTNKDGSISGAELAGNALLKPFMTGDVDVDGDGKKEVSMGVGFTAVGASISTP